MAPVGPETVISSKLGFFKTFVPGVMGVYGVHEGISDDETLLGNMELLRTSVEEDDIA